MHTAAKESATLRVAFGALLVGILWYVITANETESTGLTIFNQTGLGTPNYPKMLELFAGLP